jgi:hypothetical protein
VTEESERWGEKGWERRTSQGLVKVVYLFNSEFLDKKPFPSIFIEERRGQ